MNPCYRDDPEALRALVQPDRVHRDLYLSPELFELEQERFFARTWNYLAHDSQIPEVGDYLTVEHAGRPLIVVRHTDRSVRVLMRQHRQVLPLPLPRLDLQDRRRPAGDTAQARL